MQHLAALADLAEATVRRWSYAGAFVGAMAVVTIGLALCGTHLIRGGDSDMENRRTFLGIAAASLLPGVLDAQTPTATGELARHSLNGPLEGFEVVLLERNFRPGAGAPHRHPGIVLGYVMDGQYRFAINNEPERIVPAGGTFFEPVGATHTTSGSDHATAPARVLVFMVMPKGSPTVINP